MKAKNKIYQFFSILVLQSYYISYKNNFFQNDNLDVLESIKFIFESFALKYFMHSLLKFQS